jgi:ribonuclease Y
MNQLTLFSVGILAFVAGAILGYYARQSLAKRRAGTIEQKLQSRISEAKQESSQILENARQEVRRVLETGKATEQLLLSREAVLERKILEFEDKNQEVQKDSALLLQQEQKLTEAKADIAKKLEIVAHMSQQEALGELMKRVEDLHEKDIVGRMKKLEAEGQERFDRRAKEIVAYAVQKTAVSQAQEITTSTVALPSEDIKGKIIGKEGRNIRSLERLAGVEIVVDETPEAVVISGFDPVRRHIAKTALERLIKDGRIHPARIEEEVAKAEKEIDQQTKEAGEATAYDLGIVGLDPKLIQLLGRLKFRTSYGQNVLLHSLEVAYLASALASEIGVNATIAKKAGLFHDIGKALDHEIEGSHVDIGMRVLEKFGVEKEVILAMKSHHEDYPYESIEAVIIQTADAISASRPGARKDTLENYLKRIGELENLAKSFQGVEKAYAIQAGREIRVFVKSGEIDDVASKNMARDIANRIQEELRYPGEIKVTLIRENRFVEVAR